MWPSVVGAGPLDGRPVTGLVESEFLERVSCDTCSRTPWRASCGSRFLTGQDCIYSLFGASLVFPVVVKDTTVPVVVGHAAPSCGKWDPARARRTHKASVTWLGVLPSPWGSPL
jgi:hypothetical protein